MGKITIFRESDYMNYAIDVKLSVNGKEYTLPSTSSIDIEIPEKQVQLFASYRWFKSSKVTLDLDQTNYQVRVAPVFNNGLLLLQLGMIVASFVLAYLTNSELFTFLFRLITLSILGLYLSVVTLGYRKYFKLEFSKIA
jgi:hypothetical protein